MATAPLEADLAVPWRGRNDKIVVRMVLALIVVISAARARLRAAPSSISGVVVDSSSGVIPGATVTVKRRHQRHSKP
jgi:hypothetical protein